MWGQLSAAGRRDPFPTWSTKRSYPRSLRTCDKTTFTCSHTILECAQGTQLRVFFPQKTFLFSILFQIIFLLVCWYSRSIFDLFIYIYIFDQFVSRRSSISPLFGIITVQVTTLETSILYGHWRQLVFFILVVIAAHTVVTITFILSYRTVIE